MGTDSNRGQSQRELHGFEDSSAAGEQRANAQGDHSNRGQSQRVLHSSEDGSATAEQKGKHDATLGSDANPGQSQRDLHTAPVNASNDPHSRSSLNAGSKDKATDDAGQADTAAAPEFGYSFHFKNEMAASKASDVFEVPVRPAPDSIAHVPHAAGHDGPALDPGCRSAWPFTRAAKRRRSRKRRRALFDARLNYVAASCTAVRARR